MLLPERNVSRRHARLTRQGTAFLLEDLGSSNGTRVNGQRIEGPVPVGPTDVVRIGDYGVALRPDDASLATPVPRDPPPPVAAPARPDGLADTAPHPLLGAPAPAIAAPTSDVPPEDGVPWVAPRRRSAVVAVIGLALGLVGGALALRAVSSGSRRAVVPAPEAMQPSAAAAPQAPSDDALELTPPTVAPPVPATAPARPSTATEWLAAARAAAGARDFDRGLKLLANVRDRAYQTDVAGLKKTWKAESTAGKAVKSARHELDQGRPSVALKQLDAAKGTQAWAAEAAAVRTDAAAALKAPRRKGGRAASPDEVERLYRDGKTRYEAGDVGDALGKFERCLSLDPVHARCHLMLATSSMRAGDPARAEAHYRRFLELAAADDPAVPRVKKFLEDSDAQKKARALR